MATKARWVDRHPVIAPVCITVISTAAAGLLVWLASKLIPQPIQDAMWSWLATKTAWPRGLWLLLLLATAAWPLFGAWSLGRWYVRRPPPHESYRTDEFFELRWRWSWRSMQATGFRAFCPKCDIELTPRGVGTGILGKVGEVIYECPNRDCLNGHKPVRFSEVIYADAVKDAARFYVEREARKRKLLPD